MPSRKRRSSRFRLSGSAPVVAVLVAVFACALLLGGASSFRQVFTGPTAFNYTANLLNDGAPVDDACSFKFALYTDKFGGQRIGGEQEQALRVADSVFAARLDFGRRSSEIDAFYLDIVVHCPTVTDQPVQLVRQRLNARKPYDMQGFMDLVANELGDPFGPPAPSEYPDTVIGLLGSRLSDHWPWSMGYYQDLDGEYAAFGWESGPQPRGAKAGDTIQGNDGVKKGQIADSSADRQPGVAPGQQRADGTKGHRIGASAWDDRP
jgi:hypothetical protein